MKIFCILLAISILHVEAQRRSQTRQELKNADSTQPRGRGRSRFTYNEPDYSSSSETPSRRIPSRKRPEPVTSEIVEKPNYPAPLSSTQSYAVEEIIDEGGATPEMKALPEPIIEPQISSKSAENDNESSDRRSPAETSGENFSDVKDITNTKLQTDTSSSFRENLEDVEPKLNEKVVPITRNNVRNGMSRTVDRRIDNEPRTERRFKNVNSGNTNDHAIPSSRSSPRSRGEKNLSTSRRKPSFEDSESPLNQDPLNEVTFPKIDNPSFTNKLSDPVRDEEDIRREIVRNSMPKLPSPIGIASILSEPPLPKKTIKKTIRTRVNDNTGSVESAIPSRGRSNQRTVENFEASPRASSNTRKSEGYGTSSRGRSSGDDTQSLRSRSNNAPKANESVTPGRSRTRATRKPAEVTPSPTIPSRRNGRRRPDSVTTGAPLPRRSPSVSSSVEESPSTRSRTGRRIEPVLHQQTDPTQSPRSPSGRGRSRSTFSTDQIGSNSRRQTVRSRNEELSRQRSPPILDESKLEVLPLFEGETKIISEPGRRANQLDQLVPSATENEKKVINPPEATTPTFSIRSDVSTSSRVTSMKVRRKLHRKTEIRESAESQVTEVTSKRTITRKPIARPGGRRVPNKNSLEIKSGGLTSSEENISDSDNYPEPFKALIQSKKQIKESRPSNVPEEDSKSKKLVSSSEAPRSVLASPNVPSRTTTYPIKYSEELDNEVHPKASSTSTTLRPTKKRLSPSFKNLELKNKKSAITSVGKAPPRSTVAPPQEQKDNIYHSKFNSVTKNNAVPMPKPFNSSAAKGLYFNRKNKDNEKYSINRTRNAVDVGNNRIQSTYAPLQKSSRYSSKYRSNGSSRSVPRSSTSPPAYIPTIPSVRSYSATVIPKEDPDLGLEYITFDVPSRSISSANLIKGDYQASEDANSNSLDPKQEKVIQTTEKPVSIIERIINSITGINITTEPTNIEFASLSTLEPTKSSAILSLAPKKSSEKFSRTDDSTQQKQKSNKRDAATSEKPTTIIQRILDSLSAIQAATTTETTTVVTTDNLKQVGTNFNTLSAKTTTPSQLDLETASFSSTLAPSTTINPLVVLDTISDEQVLQKRTIGKLLDILNSLTTQPPDSTKLPQTTKLVYVTPKLSNYLYATPSVTSVGTLKPLTDETSTYKSLLTSIGSSPEPFTSSIFNTDPNTELIMMKTTTTDPPLTTTTKTSTTTTDVPSTTTTDSPLSTTTDSPLSISLGLSTTPQYIEGNILYSTTPRNMHPIIMNIKSLFDRFSNIPSSTYKTFGEATTTSKTPLIPTATSLFTPAVTVTEKPSSTQLPTTSVPLFTASSTPAEVSTPMVLPVDDSNNVSPMNGTTSSDDSSVSITSTLTPDSGEQTSSSTDITALTTESSTIQESTLATELTTTRGPDIPAGTTSSSSTDSISSYFSTLPTLPRFQVSPDSVSVFSANDLISNVITPDDLLTSTISIPGKNSDNGFTTENIAYSTVENELTVTSDKTTDSSVGTGSFTTLGRITSTPTETVPTTSSVVHKTTTLPTLDSTTTLPTITTGNSVVPNISLSTISPSTTNGTAPGSGRMGKLLQNLEEEVSNNIDTSSMGPDYYVFAVLPNNTILRKRPIVYPKETPFVIVGVYPNNTVIRKYLNGTLVPMEPVIRVSGFDTRANPPPLQDITSNQVTPDQGNELDNPKREMVSTTLSSSVNSLNSTTNKPEIVATTTEMTAMINSTTVESVTEEDSSSSTTVILDNVISSSTPVPSTTLPSISELLNGKTVQAYNSLVNNTPPFKDTMAKVEDNAIASSTLPVLPTENRVTVAPLSVAITETPSFLSTLITTLQSIGTTRLSSQTAPTTQIPFRFSSTYRAPLTIPISTTTAPTTTSIPPTTPISTTRRSKPTTTRGTTTTERATSTIPLTTTSSPTTTVTNTPMVIMSEVEDSSTPPPFTSKPAGSSRTGKGLSTTVFPYFNLSDFPLLSLFSTERPRRTESSTKAKFTTTASTTAPTTTTTITTTSATTTTEKISTITESLEELLKKPIDSIKPRRKLTEQQKQDLEMIRRLEKEQAAILKQLSLLTNLNLNNLGNGQSGNLANRLISLAKDRDSRRTKTEKPKTTTTTTTTTTEPTTTSKKSEDEAEKERMRQIESLIKLLNMNGVTPSPQKETTYGTSNDAILAALLKERGIGPSTPKQLADQLEQSGFFTQTNEITTEPTTKPTRRTTRKPKATTQATRGPILQRLNWLLDAIAPPPTKAPSRKPKSTTRKPKAKVVDEDILTNEPTQLTPVVSPSTKKPKENSLSQEDIKKLIKQLEAIQKDPSAAKNLDLTPFKSLQNLKKENVQVFMPGSSGISEIDTTRPVTRAISQKNSKTTTETPSAETTTKKKRSGARPVRTSSVSPISVSNSIQDEVEEEVPVTKGRPTIPPVRLRPVSGVSDDAGSMVRGRLLTAAVNVTRAISGFLGSAFQDAVKNLARTLSTGSLTNIVGGSSIPSSSDVAPIDEDYS